MARSTVRECKPAYPLKHASSFPLHTTACPLSSHGKENVAVASGSSRQAPVDGAGMAQKQMPLEAQSEPSVQCASDAHFVALGGAADTLSGTAPDVRLNQTTCGDAFTTVKFLFWVASTLVALAVGTDRR